MCINIITNQCEKLHDQAIHKNFACIWENMQYCHSSRMQIKIVFFNHQTGQGFRKKII